jgi:hypothetical protein
MITTRRGIFGAGILSRETGTTGVLTSRRAGLLNVKSRNGSSISRALRAKRAEGVA